jgi:hypothetical protein
MKEPNNKSLGVLTIATNVYIEYWEEMVLSLEEHLIEGQKCVAHVFTEQLERASRFAKRLNKVSVQVHEIPAYKWPDATIRRYEVFTKYADQIEQDVLMHLDADMLILENIFEDVFEFATESDVVLIAHPGFWNRKIPFRLRIAAFIRSKPLNGSWETNPRSQAFVHLNHRKPYACGGIWFGKKNAIFSLMSQLAEAVEIDRDNSVMAVWHDESHLNHWASKNEFLMLSPEYCFVREYKHLKNLKPKVLAVTKKISTR